MCGRGRGKGTMFGAGMFLIGMAVGILISMVVPYGAIVFLLAVIMLALGCVFLK